MSTPTPRTRTLRATRRLASLGVLSACAMAAHAGDVSVFTLGTNAPRMNRLSNAYVSFSQTCNAVAIPSANTGVPYRLLRVRVAGVSQITIDAEPDPSTPGFDPFIAFHCSPAGLGTNNPTFALIGADDDSGGYPRARLAPGVNVPSFLAPADYFLFVASYSSRPERRFGRVKVTVTGNATFIGCPGDLNNDDQVDDADFQSFAAAYNLLVCADPAMPTGCPADLNADGFVDDVDFQVFVAAYDDLVCS